MDRWKTRTGNAGRIAIAAACLAVAPALTSAQNVISEDFTGTTINNSWTAINGACLTAGTASNGSIPSCVGLLYYLNNGDRYQVGGQNGYLGSSTAPGTNQSQTPDLSGSGALRLTNGSPYYHESGAIVSTVPFDATSGVQVTFKTVTYRGDSGGSGGDGADGISFFLLDASKYAAGSGLLGSWGGSLGYTCSNVNPPYTGQVGAYVGLGIDEYGNFLNGGANGSGGYNDNTAVGVPASGWGSGNYQWNRIGLRGAGTVAWSWLNAHYANYYPSSLTSAQQSAAVQKTCQTGLLWNYSASASNPTNTGVSVADYAPIPGGSAVLPESLTIANESATKRSQATPIYYVLKINNAGQLSLSYSYNGGALTQVLSNQSIMASNGALPSSLLFGFAGSTGGSDNVHEIMCFQAAPADQSDSSTTVNLPQDKLVTTAQVYLPSYHTTNWWGQLTAQTLSVTGSYSLAISPTVNWDASCVLTGGACPSMGGTGVTAEGPSSRTILSWNGTTGVAFQWSNLSSTEQAALDPGVASTGTSNRLLYLRGDRSNEVPSSGPSGTQIYRDRTSVLGDIIHSSPFWVGPPANPNYEMTWTDNLYPGNGALENSYPYVNFNNTYSGRENVVYIGANDGLLHGFRSGSMSNGTMVTTSYPNDGHEVLAYMPGAVAQAIHSTTTAYDYSSPQYSHAYSVDAPPRARDLFYSGAWHTWLAGGLGAGGSAIYALDVTDPTTFSEANAASIVKGEWTPSTLACSNTSPQSACGLNLGNTYGTPVIARFHAASGGSNMWGMTFGNGFPNQITASMSTSFTGSISNGITGSIGAEFTGSISSTTLTVTAGSFLSVGQPVTGPGVTANTTVTAISGGSCSVLPCGYSVNNRQTVSSEQMYTSGTTMYVTNGSGIAVGQSVTGPGVASGTTVVSQLTGTTGSVGTYTLSVSQLVASEQLTLPGTTLTVTAGGGLAVGQTINGANVALGTTITALGTGTGGIGTYTVSVSQVVASEQMNNGVSTMTVTAGAGLAVGQTILGAGVAAGTKILSFVTGTGGPGTYTVSNSQTVASSQLTTGSSTGTAGIYVMLVNPSSGAQSFYYLDTGYGPNQDPTGQGRANGIAYTTPADLDGDNTVDYVYAGDLFGNIWRFDLTSSNPAQWSASTFGGSSPRPLFSTPTSTVNGASVGQPFTTKLMVWGAPIGNGGSGVIIIGGTGQEYPLTPVSPVSYAPGPQGLYGVWDWDMSHWNSISHMGLASLTASQYSSALGGPIGASSLSAQTISESGTLETDTMNSVCWYGSTACGTGNTTFGWKIALPGAGEQVIYNPTISQGNLQINTTIPSASTVFSCTVQLPTGWTMMINPTTGGGFASSAFLDSSGNPMTANGSPVAGMLTNGTGSVTNLTGAGTPPAPQPPPTPGNNPCGSGLNSVASLSSQGFWVTDTANGTATGGAMQSHSSMCGHRVTWTELR
jgi:Tfp pilus tip-associated adhesin PilY1